MKSQKLFIALTFFLTAFSLHAKTETEQIAITLNNYIEGTANGDPERIAEAFHPELNLYTVKDDSLTIRNGKKYISNFKNGKKYNRIGKIVSIDYVNDAATAKIEIQMPHLKRIYTDYLLLMKYQASWKIIHKSYTFIEIPTKDDNSNELNISNKNEVVMSGETPKVTGIGGIFFKSKNPKESKEWYGKNLGLAIGEYGSPFEFRNANRPDEINYLNWSPFDENTEYFAPSEKEFMINYRVQNIVGLVEKLKANGVTIVDEIESYDYGKFVHIMDPEGNKIELWEPVDSVFTAMGGETTK